MSNLTEAIQTEITRLARREIKKSLSQANRSAKTLKRAINRVQQNINALEKKMMEKIEALNKIIKNQTPSAEVETETTQKRLSPLLLKKLRKHMQISQKGLAQLVNVSPQAVASWEQGRVMPRGQNRARIIALRALSPAQVKKELTARGAKTAKRKIR